MSRFEEGSWRCHNLGFWAVCVLVWVLYLFVFHRECGGPTFWFSLVRLILAADQADCQPLYAADAH